MSAFNECILKDTNFPVVYKYHEIFIFNKMTCSLPFFILRIIGNVSHQGVKCDLMCF